MAEIYFTSDHHFGHEGIIAMCNRPFSSLEEMDAVMIQRWNETVRPADTVYHLGDFAHKATAERAAQVFKRLNGKKHLVIGNHDKLHVRELPWASAPADRLYVRHPREAMPIVCDHYAARVWSKSHHGALHFYGHSHGSLPGAGNSLDVGVDCWDFRPVTLEEIRLRIAEQTELEEIAAMVAADEEASARSRGP